MRIHHLNCGSLCPRGGSLLGGAGGPLSPAPMCCHCLLIEGDDRLILVDTGLGVEDVNEPRRLGFLFNTLARPRLKVAETALRQVADLGYRPSDVRHIVPTHLDLDHAGGLIDFPGASVHVYAPELKAALNPPTLVERNRYRAVQLAGVAKWAPVEADGEDWCGFSSVRALPGARDDFLLIPLPGHTRGHCGVAVWGGFSIAATPISTMPRLRPQAAGARRASGGSSPASMSTRQSEWRTRNGCSSSRAITAAR